MRKFKTMYQWLDDFGEVTSIQSYPPVDRPYKKIRVCVFDTEQCEDALF